MGAQRSTSTADILMAAVMAVSRFAGQKDTNVRVSLRDGDAVHIQTSESRTVAEYRETLLAQCEKIMPADEEAPVQFLVDVPEEDSSHPSLTVTRDAVSGRTAVAPGPGNLPEWLEKRLSSGVAHLHAQLSDPLQQQRTLAETTLQDAAAERAVVELGRAADLSTELPGSIHAAFTAQALRTPDAVALTDLDTQISYRELDEWADEISGRLRGAGVERGSRVGVLLDRSAATVAALLAVLKAGAVYVPMDADMPDERLSFMATDCDLVLVITEDADRTQRLGLKAMTGQRLGDAPAHAPEAEEGSVDDPAYIIFTSGSTGRPKGVAVAHKSVLSLVAATVPDFAFGPTDVWPWFHSVGFDLSVWEMWGCLLTGGRLVVVPESARHSPEEFRGLLSEQQVTVLTQTPSSFMQLMELECRQPIDLRLRLVVFGGETLDTAGLGRWIAVHPLSECRLVNMYGITETTVHVTAQEISEELVSSASKSVGRAIPGWSIRVVDSHRRPLPPGAVGEIAVGGAGVALGYVNRADLTAQRFVVDPVSGERIYLSGDRGRMLIDGAVEHLGRFDHQIKLRGHRIELGEIRAVLLAQQDVLAAAVVVCRPFPEDPACDRLDAYVVLAPDAGPWDAVQVRRRISTTLPEYMLPATITPVPVMPLTANGKLDVAALPAPRLPRSEAPANDTEALVLACWEKAIGLESGLDMNFFDVGGNSLLAARVVAALREAGIESAGIADVYRHQTPRLLAALYARAE